MCQETIDPTDNASDPQPIAPNHNPPPPPACNSAFVHPNFFPLHLHPPQLLAPRTASPLPEREPPPAGRVRRPRLPPPPPRFPPPPGGRGSAPRRPLRALHPLLTTQRGGRPLPLALRPPRAPCPRRAASGGARRSPTPLRAGGWRPGPYALAHSGGPGAVGSRPGKGLRPRAVTRARPFAWPRSQGVMGERPRG